MMSDASGSRGCGAWHGSHWFQVQWDNASQSLTIAEKELIQIILGFAAWGRAWSGHRVTCHCDNQVVISCLRSRSSKHKGSCLIRCLLYVEAKFNMFIEPVYIDTKINHLADDLSWNNLHSFLLKVPQADHSQTSISTQLLGLFLNQQADWTHLTWRPLFSAIFRVA